MLRFPVSTEMSRSMANHALASGSGLVAAKPSPIPVPSSISIPSSSASMAEIGPAMVIDSPIREMSLPAQEQFALWQRTQSFSANGMEAVRIHCELARFAHNRRLPQLHEVCDQEVAGAITQRKRIVDKSGIVLRVVSWAEVMLEQSPPTVRALLGIEERNFIKLSDIVSGLLRVQLLADLHFGAPTSYDKELGTEELDTIFTLPMPRTLEALARLPRETGLIRANIEFLGDIAPLDVDRPAELCVDASGIPCEQTLRRFLPRLIEVALCDNFVPIKRHLSSARLESKHSYKVPRDLYPLLSELGPLLRWFSLLWLSLESAERLQDSAQYDELARVAQELLQDLKARIQPRAASHEQWRHTYIRFLSEELERKGPVLVKLLQTVQQAHERRDIVVLKHSARPLYQHCAQVFVRLLERLEKDRVPEAEQGHLLLRVLLSDEVLSFLLGA